MAGYGNIGPYELVGELGRGALARTWLAWDPNLEREVAIKELMPDEHLPQDALEEMGRRFVREGRAMSRLNHPGIVDVYAADVWDGRPAIVMELIDGETLSSLLSRGPLTPSEALAVLDQLLDAVGYAHERGVVHRDIKPDNVFVARDGIVKLADFGMALVEGPVGTVVGSVALGYSHYMSPEQAKGERVDARSDLFSIAVMGYEMLTGQSPSVAWALPADATEGLSANMGPAIMSALSEDPCSRPRSARELKEMLHRDVVLEPPKLPINPRRSITLPAWLPYVALALVVALVLGMMLC